MLALFALVAHGPRIGLAFVGDDYVFLDKTRSATFAELWSPFTSIDFGWYRPWARELHFWGLQHLFGAAPAAFRIANIALWVLILCLYAMIVSQLSTRRVAAIATLGVAALAFWGTPLLWISGSQDLWMLVFALLCFLLVINHHSSWATPVFALALLSKETAAVLPALLCAYLLVVRRNSWSQALRATSLFWGVLLTWAVLHPTLHRRFVGGLAGTAEVQHRPPWPVIVVKNVAASINADRLPRPQEVTAAVVIGLLLTVSLLAGGLSLAAHRNRACVPPGRLRLLLTLAGAWAVIGWCPSLLPSIGWHAYYGCLGALGLWFGIALCLESRPRAAVVAVAALALLRGAQANTLSSDWGDETYFRRAGTTLAAIRTDLIRQHPTFPPHSRVYFSEIPYHIGLVAGDSPALRVWYGDSTLDSGYYSYYRPRAQGALPGVDYFFRFDSVAGMVEVKAGDENVGEAVSRDRNWEIDHKTLATLFLDKGDVGRAAEEFEKVSSLPQQPGAAIYAAEGYGLMGDSMRSESLAHAAQLELGASKAHMSALRLRVRADILSRRGTVP